MWFDFFLFKGEKSLNDTRVNKTDAIPLQVISQLYLLQAISKVNNVRLEKNDSSAITSDTLGARNTIVLQKK